MQESLLGDLFPEFLRPHLREGWPLLASSLSQWSRAWSLGFKRLSASGEKRVLEGPFENPLKTWCPSSQPCDPQHSVKLRRSTALLGGVSWEFHPW